MIVWNNLSHFCKHKYDYWPVWPNLCDRSCCSGDRKPTELKRLKTSQYFLDSHMVLMSNKSNHDICFALYTLV